MNTFLAMTKPIAIAPRGHIGFVQSGLGACCTCEFLQRKAAKIPDFGAPLGVCKVKIVQKARFLSLKCTKCDRLLAGKKELIFRDTAALMKHRLQEKTQNGVSLFLCLRMGSGNIFE